MHSSTHLNIKIKSYRCEFFCLKIKQSNLNLPAWYLCCKVAAEEKTCNPFTVLKNETFVGLYLNSIARGMLVR